MQTFFRARVGLTVPVGGEEVSVGVDGVGGGDGPAGLPPAPRRRNLHEPLEQTLALRPRPACPGRPRPALAATPPQHHHWLGRQGRLAVVCCVSDSRLRCGQLSPGGRWAAGWRGWWPAW